MTTYHLGEIIVGEVASPAQRLERSTRMIARQGLDHVLVSFHESGGSRVDTGRRRVAVEGRQGVVLDLSQPVVIDADPGSAATLLIPRRLVSDEVGLVETLHGQVFAYDADPAKQLLHAYLRGLLACGPRLEPHHLPGVSHAASKLCGACFPADAGARAPVDGATHVAIRRFIQSELTSLTLGTEAITQRFGLSRATLYRLFEEEGGVINYIRDRRLMLAMRLLTEAGGARRRVAQVAYAAGFADEKTFSRAFKRRFGLLPREARADTPPRPPGPEKASVLMGWIRSLAA